MKAALAIGLSLTAAVVAGSFTSLAQAEAAAAAEKEYTKADVQAHKTKETGVWVTYQGGVYDITNFAENHPGRGGGEEGGREGRKERVMWVHRQLVSLPSITHHMHTSISTNYKVAIKS